MVGVRPPSTQILLRILSTATPLRQTLHNRPVPLQYLPEHHRARKRLTSPTPTVHMQTIALHSLTLRDNILGQPKPRPTPRTPHPTPIHRYHLLPVANFPILTHIPQERTAFPALPNPHTHTLSQLHAGPTHWEDTRNQGHFLALRQKQALCRLTLGLKMETTPRRKARVKLRAMKS